MTSLKRALACAVALLVPAFVGAQPYPNKPSLFVIPAKAGIQGSSGWPHDPWMPAFAGMTGR